MPAPDTASRRALEDDGFAMLPALARDSELVQLRAAVAARLGSSHEGACERPHNTLLSLRWNDGIVAQLLGAGERVEAIAQATGASDLRWISGYVSSKEPFTPPLWWHQDWWCWDHEVSFLAAAPQVALLLYLSDTTSSNGALRVLPGSHLQSAPIHALLPEAHGGDAEQLDASHPAFEQLPGQRTLSLSAGDAVVLDYRVLHGTHANNGPSRRDAILLTFTPSWSGLPDDVRGHLVDHPALPREDERVPVGDCWQARLLPCFGGVRGTLPLNRTAPSEFAIARGPAESRLRACRSR